MEYQDSEVYREESENNKNWLTIIEHEDGSATFEMDTDSPPYILLAAIAEVRGVSVQTVLDESIQAYWDNLITDHPHLAEILEFWKAFNDQPST